ncbi:MAG: PAS domain-containing sensor histidine kinase [Candidatus Rifleibacteriota bacterium]
MLLLFDLNAELIYADDEAEALFDLSGQFVLTRKLVDRIVDSGTLEFSAEESGLPIKSPIGSTAFMGSIRRVGNKKIIRLDFAKQTIGSASSEELLERVYNSTISEQGSDHSEKRLRVSEKTMATIFDAAVDAMVIIDDSGIILGFNRSAERIFKISAEMAIGQNVTIFMPEPHKSRHNSYIKRYLETGIPHIVGIGRRVEALRSDGETFPIDLAVAEVKLESGRIFTGFVRDLSESIRLEDERNSFFQMSMDMFCILDNDCCIKNANPSWFDILGWSPQALEGRSLADLIHPEDLGHETDLIRQIASSRQIVGRITRFSHVDGEYRWILWSSARNPAGNVIYGVARDVTEQRKMLTDLETARADAERSSDARGMFIARMSHELRTPLNSIIGFSGILKRNSNGHFSEKDLLFIDRIKQNGNTLLKLINGILEFSRTQSGFQEINAEEVNVSLLLHEILDLMQVSIEEKKVSVALDLHPNPELIRTDAVKLRQILQNLIDNAVKFSSGGQVEILLKTRNNFPEAVEVKDSGPGIASQHLETIFEAFMQCDNSITRRYGGAGLGLAIASSFADLLGFKIEVDSTLGQGSCFRLVFSSMKGKEA